MYECPICFKKLTDLDQVNEHIDRSHLSLTAFAFDKTNLFKKLRQQRLKETGLQKLVIEKRFNKLINYVQSHGTEVTGRQLSEFEKTIVDWRHDQKHCTICTSNFDWFQRKHHCRICGETVCNDSQRGCSMEVPISMIMKIFNIQNNWELKIRVCSNCKKLALSKRIFESETNSADLLVVSLWKRWKLLSDKIDQLDLTVVRDDNENALFVGLFTKLDNLIKEIESIVNENENADRNKDSDYDAVKFDEINMLKNLKIVVFNYIQTNLPILRKSQENKLMEERQILKQLTSKTTLSKREIREKREKLMVLNEQKFLVEEMYTDFKKQRKFEDLKTLDSSLSDIQKEIDQLVIELGDESF